MEAFPILPVMSGHSICTGKWTTEKEFYPPIFRFYFVVKGEAFACVGETRHKLSAGYCYFLPANISSRNICRNRMEVYWLHGVFNPLVRSAFCLKADKVLRWRLETFRVWDDCYLRLGTGEENPGGASRWQIQSMLLWIYASLTRQCATEPEHIDAMTRKMALALDFMQECYRGNPPLRDIAAQAGLAANYFHRVFVKFSGGLTPHKFMEQLRMRDAWKMLMSSDISLKRLASELGYNNVFYFSRAFKKIFGRSPRYLRNDQEEA
jgi:AraC-like DNA-binding protein